MSRIRIGALFAAAATWSPPRVDRRRRRRPHRQRPRRAPPRARRRARAPASEAPSASSDAGTPKDGGTLVVGLPGDMVRADPALVSDSNSSYVAPAGRRGPRRARRPAPASELVPVLATDWTVSADGLTYTFKLREGVKFHDGTDVRRRRREVQLRPLDELPERASRTTTPTTPAPSSASATTRTSSSPSTAPDPHDGRDHAEEPELELPAQPDPDAVRRSRARPPSRRATRTTPDLAPRTPTRRAPAAPARWSAPARSCSRSGSPATTSRSSRTRATGTPRTAAAPRRGHVQADRRHDRRAERAPAGDIDLAQTVAPNDIAVARRRPGPPGHRPRRVLQPGPTSA